MSSNWWVDKFDLFISGIPFSNKKEQTTYMCLKMDDSWQHFKLMLIKYLLVKLESLESYTQKINVVQFHSRIT